MTSRAGLSDGAIAESLGESREDHVAAPSRVEQARSHVETRLRTIAFNMPDAISYGAVEDVMEAIDELITARLEEAGF